MRAANTLPNKGEDPDGSTVLDIMLKEDLED
jgi:hypothetical protein